MKILLYRRYMTVKCLFNLHVSYMTDFYHEIFHGKKVLRGQLPLQTFFISGNFYIHVYVYRLLIYNLIDPMRYKLGSLDSRAFTTQNPPRQNDEILRGFLMKTSMGTKNLCYCVYVNLVKSFKLNINHQNRTYHHLRKQTHVAETGLIVLFKERRFRNCHSQDHKKEETKVSEYCELCSCWFRRFRID